MKEIIPILPVLIGPPGVGKTTIAEIINNLPNARTQALDGDSFISEEGIARLKNNTWDDSDRFAYLSNMARGAIAKIKSNCRIVLIDAMTTRWMRQYFTKEVTSNANIEIKWVEVRRDFQHQEIDALIEERRLAGHPINSRQVFERFSSQFEPLDPPFDRLINPGATHPLIDLKLVVYALVEKLYENNLQTVQR